MSSGYYRHPTLHHDTVVFVCEDDLWTVPTAGGVARRLTSNLGPVSWPRLSADGQHLAFVGSEDGESAIYVMPALGGPARRVTHLGGSNILVGWLPTEDGTAERILFANNAGQPFATLFHLYTVGLKGDVPTKINLGPARTLSLGPNQMRVIGRNTVDPARWKRYRGGTAGQLWIDDGSSAFKPLVPHSPGGPLQGNLSSPMFIGHADAPRIYFIADHEGIGNLYSCQPDGHGLRRHTHHEDYYARHACADSSGQGQIVYQAGADLFLFNVETSESRKIEIDFRSSQTQRHRKFVSAGRYTDGWALHPKGHSTALTTRGKLFAFANFEGAVQQLGETPQPAAADVMDATDTTTTATRYRLAEWLNDGQRIVAVTDEAGEERIVVFHLNPKPDQPNQPAYELLDGLDIGRPLALQVNPKQDQLVLSNHRHELIFIDLTTRELKRIDRGRATQIMGFDWSPDGVWVAYACSISLQNTAIKLWNAATGEIHQITQPVLQDYAPAFDPQGRFLYFISQRDFTPTNDALQFEYSFLRGQRPYLITLQKETLSPFVPRLKPDDEKDKAKEKDKDKRKDTEAAETPSKDDEAASAESNPNEANPPAEGADVADIAKADRDKKDKPGDKPIQIDLDGITERILAFPVAEGRYGQIIGTKGGRVLYTRYPVEAATDTGEGDKPEAGRGVLFAYDFESLKEEVFVTGVINLDMSRDHARVIYRSGWRLRVLNADSNPSSDDSPGRRSGWLDLTRIKVPVVPTAEWRQMFREAWRLQRDQFWTPDMSQVDWLAVHDRYLPLVDRVSCRSEFSDLMWEMQGELGTSHAYEFGGDYRSGPNYAQGYLGADCEFDETANRWRITKLVHGDAWNEDVHSPLLAPGINAQIGDAIIAIAGHTLSKTFTPAASLINLAGEEVTLELADSAGQSRMVTVKTLDSEGPARYREWVEDNRRRVHDATQGRIGYVHVPDMGARGFAEFHRSYLAELGCDGLVVDVRYNGGGNVSSLILEKLARKRIGYSVSRWGEIPQPYMYESIGGPLVALTNEHAGSDGDIFCHSFKQLKLGPLIGKRTWGGVVGIWPRHALVDGTVTTQPEFSFWFEDVGWGVENYGIVPDIEIDNTPEDYARHHDAQLERAIEEALRLLEANPPRKPAFDQRPSRAIPKLPQVE